MKNNPDKYCINTKVFDHFPGLESDRLLLQPITLQHAETLYNIRSNDRVMAFMDTEHMQSISDAEELIRAINDEFSKGAGINWGMIDKNSRAFIGYFGIWRIDARHCRGEIGYALHPDYWGKGYMLEAAKKVIAFGFHELDIHSFEANVNPGNEASIRLLQKLGFRKEAYFRENYLFNNEFKDSVIYSLLERDLDIGLSA